jgi:hypothetical protein
VRNPVSGKVDCPMHLFRTSKDIRPWYGAPPPPCPFHPTSAHRTAVVFRPNSMMLLGFTMLLGLKPACVRSDSLQLQTDVLLLLLVLQNTSQH